ncbi:MAG TPA: polysaccharide deacetylase family protein [Bacteroidales bacterium]|nr:polysaccharide deacetylase family protein [Bacteroidales bacterium]
MLIARIPGIFARIFKNLTWEIPNDNNEVYLTFDDGPTPTVTEWVLDQLKQRGYKATFFCLGNNVKQHPQLFERIRAEGHAVGNHSYSHVKGFRKSVDSYIEDVDRASELIDSRLYRPPYGRILPRQVKKLKNNYRIIMWSVLSVDYNAQLSGDRVVRNVTDNLRPGVIIVFHDSLKASENLYYALPKVLDHIHEKGYRLSVLSGDK